ncbi:MAG: biotin transporter BioY [Lachnospiraceae bacterium]|nr:biotin transporter BioY [Lachnospiraceae bacterium]
MAMFAAVLCVAAYLTITLPNGSHITLLNFAILLVALTFPASQGFCITLVWLLLGAVGVPVFAGGNAGLGYLFGNYGGYILGLLITPVVVPLLSGQKYHRVRATLSAVFSVIMVDLIGMIQWMLLAHLGLKEAFIAGFMAFIILDLVKAIIAAQIAPALRLAIHTANS